MELILFAVVSVIIARYFEKRFIIAASAHAVLFLIFGICLLYCSDCEVIIKAMRSISGDVAYDYIRCAFKSPLDIFFFGYSAYLIVDIVIIAMIVAVSAAVGELIHRKASQQKVFSAQENGKIQILPRNPSVYNGYKERKYIKYCRMLN